MAQKICCSNLAKHDIAADLPNEKSADILPGKLSNSQCRINTLTVTKKNSFTDDLRSYRAHPNLNACKIPMH